MEIIAAAKRYSKNAAADFIKFGCYLTNPVSQRTVTMAMGAAMFGMIVLNIATANAASTPLFVQLMDAFQTLLTEVQDVNSYSRNSFDLALYDRPGCCAAVERTGYRRSLGGASNHYPGVYLLPAVSCVPGYRCADLQFVCRRRDWNW